jgi:phosphoglycolate phosphatase-like HAD superfamily hydrolase
MRYEFIVFDLDVLGAPAHAAPAEGVLRDLTDLGATLGLVAECTESEACSGLGPAQHLFDAFDCGPTPGGIAVRLPRLMQRLAFPSELTLLVTATPRQIEAARRAGVASALTGRWPDDPPISGASHVIADLSELENILTRRPTLRIVR